MSGTPIADLAVLGGTVALPDRVARCGVAMTGGRVIAVGPEDGLPDARERFDATGCMVLPGAVDVHMHYDRESDRRLTDRVRDATRSAAHGGVTTIVAFLRAEPGRPFERTLAEATAELEAESYLDAGFHMYLTANDVDAIRELPGLVDRGVASFKMAMAYKRRGMMCSDEFLLAAMGVIGRSGGVAMVHAESGDVIDHLEQEALREGRRSPTDYAATRPPYAEAESVGRAAAFSSATGCPVHVVHLSSAAALRRLIAARADGVDIQAETCPQYLTLTDAAMAQFGPLAKIAPPLRTLEDQQALWGALADGDLAIVASDHAPYPGAQKLVAEDIYQSPFGAPTVETLVPLLHDRGVVQRGLGIQWLARVTSEMPARAFGLYPRKGAIAVGSDADLVVVDPGRLVTIDAARLHSNADYTPFAGLAVRGWPVATIVSGDVLVRDGELLRSPGRARFLPRARLTGALRDRMVVRRPLDASLASDDVPARAR